jgi:hypothetical protein
MTKRTSHRAAVRRFCVRGVVCECGHCICDHFGCSAWCDGLTGPADTHECKCSGWRRLFGPMPVEYEDWALGWG